MAHPIKRLPTGPTSVVETITPELAREWLGRNTHNRHLRGDTVSAYARDMRAGRWHFTGEAVKFAADGTLLDGQHRLQAVVQAGVSVQMLVVHGLDPATQAAMDTGRKRTAADFLSLAGEKGSALIAATAKLVLTNAGRPDRQVSHGEIAELLEAEPFLRTICTEITPRLPVAGITPAVHAYCYWRLDKVSPDRCAAFFTALHSLAELPKTSPILALNRRLTSGGTLGRRTRTHRHELVALTFMAWNAWVRNEPRTIIKLAFTADGRISISEPVAG